MQLVYIVDGFVIEEFTKLTWKYNFNLQKRKKIRYFLLKNTQDKFLNKMQQELLKLIWIF